MPSVILIAQSIAKVFIPTCFQNEALVFEHVFECVLNQHVFKMHSKHILKHVQKQGPHQAGLGEIQYYCEFSFWAVLGYTKILQQEHWMRRGSVLPDSSCS